MVSHEFDDVVQTYRVHDEAPRTFKKLRHTLALLRGAKPPLRFPTARLWEYIASASTKADRGEPLEYKQSARISPRVEELKIRLVPGHTSLATST